MEKIDKDKQIQSIVHYLTELPTEEWLSQKLATRVFRCFPSNPLATLRLFITKGWSPNDIHIWLAHNLTFRKHDPSWADSFYQIFLIEEMMIQAGLNKTTAHNLAVTQAWLIWIPPIRLQTAIQTLLNLGYAEDTIKTLADKMPYLFHLPKEQLSEECKLASRARKGLLWNGKLELTEIMLTRTLEPITSLATPKNNNPIAPIRECLIIHQETANDQEIAKPVTAKAIKPALPKKIKAKNISEDEDEDIEFDPLIDDYKDLEEIPNDVLPALDLNALKLLVESTAKDNRETAWNNYLENNHWLRSRKSSEYQACLALCRWAPIPVQAIPYKFSYKRNAGRTVRFWQMVLTKPKAKTILQVNPQILEIRMYALRRVMRNFLKEPEWLLLEWEALNEVELRYRINEIEARGKKAYLKPYIKMLLEPDRAHFLKRLDNYLERLHRSYRILLDDLDDDCLMKNDD